MITSLRNWFTTSVFLLLQPRRFTYKSRAKCRSTRLGSKFKLTYGDCGIFVLQPLRLSAKQIFRLKIFIKRAVKKSDITRRLAWFNVFPHLPLSKKSKGMRMGKGAGKLSTWFVQIRGGSSVLEFSNLRRGRSNYFFKQVSHKLPTRTRVVNRNESRFRMSHVRGLTSISRSFW